MIVKSDHNFMNFFNESVAKWIMCQRTVICTLLASYIARDVVHNFGNNRL